MPSLVVKKVKKGHDGQEYGRTNPGRRRYSLGDERRTKDRQAAQDGCGHQWWVFVRVGCVATTINELLFAATVSK